MYILTFGFLPTVIFVLGYNGDNLIYCKAELRRKGKISLRSVKNVLNVNKFKLEESWNISLCLSLLASKLRPIFFLSLELTRLVDADWLFSERHDFVLRLRRIDRSSLPFAVIIFLRLTNTNISSNYE